jgi:hypothetical protein
MHMNTFKASLALAIAMLVTPAFADGFHYSGSPKFGWSYTLAQVGGQTVARSLLDANASIAIVRPSRALIRGGIGRRDP